MIVERCVHRWDEVVEPGLDDLVPALRDDFMPGIREEGDLRSSGEPHWHGIFTQLLPGLGGQSHGDRYHPTDLAAGAPADRPAHLLRLLAVAAIMSRVDRRAAAVILATAAVEGTAYLTTDYPPAVLPLMGFQVHNRVATAHGALVIGLGLSTPGLSRRVRMALCALGSMPIALAAMSDTRGVAGHVPGR